jgi:anthranilate synthase component 1
MRSYLKNSTLYHKSVIFDELTPVSVYTKLKELFPNELSMLFESTISTENGNYSFIFIGALERVVHLDNASFYFDEKNNKTQIEQNPFLFLKKRYKEFDKSFLKEKADSLNIGFIDGFVGYIGYDAIKLFEPKLIDAMSEQKDNIKIPDINLIRPKLTLVYSLKSSTLTLLTFCKEYGEKLDEILTFLRQPYISCEIKKTKINKAKSHLAFNKQEYCDVVLEAKEMIKSGDVFQILISNRFTK